MTSNYYELLVEEEAEELNSSAAYDSINVDITAFKEWMKEELKKVDPLSERGTDLRKIQNYFNDEQLEINIGWFIFTFGCECDEYEFFKEMLLQLKESELGESDVEGIGYN